ncbi:hypothetical protein MMPV_007329 [Pyropia vietnamensis]
MTTPAAPSVVETTTPTPHTSQDADQAPSSPGANGAPKDAAQDSGGVGGVGGGGDGSRGGNKKTPRKPRKLPRSFGIRVTTKKPTSGSAAVAAAVGTTSTGQKTDAASTARESLVPESTMVETYCTHDVSLPGDYVGEYSLEGMASPPPPATAAKTYEFPLDAFQLESIKCLEARESVLVSAHTSAGKTAVAEYAIAMALRDNQRVIYTSPIKALSNQKYRELSAEFSDVGLMTGDVTINSSASCLVMTTEILRSMLYRGSEVVREVAWVVFDEVHYMRDKARGVVWEETIIMVPRSVKFVFLSATIPNAREFSEWIAHLKAAPCHTIYTSTRPVPLQHFLFPSGGSGLHLIVDEKGEFRPDSFDRALAELGGGEDAGGGGGAKGSGDSNKTPVSATKKRKRGGAGAEKGPGDCYKVVKMIVERGFQPAIVFSFSRRECESLALQLAKLNLNTHEECSLVETVFKNAMDSLSAKDRALPQITAALPLLRRGIGIHHSGLLPLVKEVVEILFSEGLVKVLFATETFAMGLNVPAKTVLFTAIRKFDGEVVRLLRAGEYVQMSGRAGRRGLDARGLSILLCDEKLEPAAARDLLCGSADPLNSTFRLGYNMLLNLLRAEEADPEFVIRRSLAQFQADRKQPARALALAELEKTRDAIDLGPLDAVQLREYVKLRDAAENLRAEMRTLVHQPATVVPFLQLGRLVRVRTPAADYGWGVIVSYRRRPASGKRSSPSEEAFAMDALLRCVPSEGGVGGSPGGFRMPTTTDEDIESLPQPAPLDGKGPSEWTLVNGLSLRHIDGLSAIRVHTPTDLRLMDQRGAVGKSVGEVMKRFAKDGGPPLLDPLEDLKVPGAKLPELIQKIEAVDERLATCAVLKSAAEGSDELVAALAAYRERAAIDEQVQAARRAVKASEELIMKDELKKMKRVLRRLGFTDAENVVQIKGRTACEVSTVDELVLTEVLLGGDLNGLSPQVAVAVLSCFVVDDSKAEGQPTLQGPLEAGVKSVRAAAKRVGDVSVECKIPMDVDKYVEGFSALAVQVVYDWCGGASFDDICANTTLFEGSIIRCFRRLEELLRQLVSATKSIGNEELETLFTNAAALLKRSGVAFAASLYI